MSEELLLGGYGLGYLLTWRPMFRRMNKQFSIHDWNDLVIEVVFCSVFTIFWPVLAMYWGLENGVVKRFDAEVVAKRLAGAPKEDKEDKIRRLQERNAELERELNLV